MDEIKNKWSEWIFFKDLNKLPEISAVYQIRGTKDLVPIFTQRLGGIDYEGILDIGQTSNLRVRMTDFWGAAGKENSNYSHQAGVIFLKRNYKNLFPTEGLQFRYLIQNNETTTREMEKQEIQNYIEKFRELPPLNSQE